MRTYQVDGIVVKRQNSGESDRILTVFTKEFGKIKVKAVGVRKIASKRSSHLELLHQSRISLYATNGFPLVTEAITLQYFPRIEESLARISCAYHLCEVIDGLCPENLTQPEIYLLLLETLRNIAKEIRFKHLIQEFEKSLLTMLGHYNNQKDTTFVIESLLEKKLKTRSMLPRLFLLT